MSGRARGSNYRTCAGDGSHISRGWPVRPLTGTEARLVVKKVVPVSVPCRFSDDLLTSAPQPGYAGEACMKLVVTIPALNEEKTIAGVVGGIPRHIPGIHDVEVIVINDGSTDRTAEEAEAAGAMVVNVKGRPGLGTIFRIGVERAMRRGADIICNIDGDGQFDPRDIAKLVVPLLRDEADFVTCSRFADPSLLPTMPRVKFLGNRVVTGLINWVCGGTKFSDVSCGFRAFNREAAYRMTLF